MTARIEHPADLFQEVFNIYYDYLTGYHHTSLSL